MKVLKKTNLEKYDNLIFKQNLPYSGFGDRIGFYLGLSVVGEILNKKIITCWRKRMDHIGEDSTDVFNLIKFPSNLLFVDYENFDNYEKSLVIPDLNNYDFEGYFIKYHGVDQVPELVWKMFSLLGMEVLLPDFMKVYYKLGRSILLHILIMYQKY